MIDGLNALFSGLGEGLGRCSEADWEADYEGYPKFEFVDVREVLSPLSFLSSTSVITMEMS